MMRYSIAVSSLFLVVAAAPASAQNIWPVSFSYWCNYPDRYMPDLLGADHSLAHANQLDGLDGGALRGLLQDRSRAMSQRELQGYHGPNMLAPIFPTDNGTQNPATRPASGSSSDSPPPGGAPPSSATSPFPPARPAEASPRTPSPVPGAPTSNRPDSSGVGPGTPPAAPLPPDPAAGSPPPPVQS